ncbi:MAG: hypothetical protein ACR2IH_09520 [Pyrinomonadaceae bacterium]
MTEQNKNNDFSDKTKTTSPTFASPGLTNSAAVDSQSQGDNEFGKLTTSGVDQAPFGSVDSKTSTPSSTMSSLNAAGSTSASKNTTSSSGTSGTSSSTLGSATTSSGSSSAAGTATAKTFVDQAKQTAGQAYDAVSEKAVTKLDEQKASLTDGLSTVADTIRQAGENLTGAGTDNSLTDAAARYTNTAAKKIEDAAQYFEQNDVRAMMRDVEGFARRNPAVFLGAAFAAGVLIARFFKADPNSAQFSGQPYSGRESNRTGQTSFAGQTSGELNR